MSSDSQNQQKPLKLNNENIIQDHSEEIVSSQALDEKKRGLSQKLMDDSSKQGKIRQISKSDLQDPTKSRASSHKLPQTIRTTWVRWVVLFFNCFMLLGLQTSQEYPIVLTDQIFNDILGYNSKTDAGNQALKTSATVKYSWMFNIGNIPNAFVPFFMGVLIQKIGVRPIAFTCCLMLMAGQLIQALAGSIGGGWNTTGAYVVFLLGRLIFYLGADSLLVAKRQEMGFALGCAQSFSRVGSALGGFIIPPLYFVNNSLFLPLIILDVLLSISWIGSIILGIVDKKREESEKLLQKSEKDPPKKKASFSLQQLIADVKRFPQLYWLLVIVLLLNFTSYQLWYTYSQQLLINAYSVPKTSVGQIQSVPSVISAVGIPLFGLFVDFFGKRQYFIVLATFLLFASLMWFLLLPQCTDGQNCNPALYWVPILTLGFYKTISLATIFPCIPLIVDKDILPSAFGAITAMSNFFILVSNQSISFLIGAARPDQRSGFLYQQILLVSMAFLSLLTSFYVFYLNSRNGNFLGLTKKEQTELTKNIRKSLRLSVRESKKQALSSHSQRISSSNIPSQPSNSIEDTTKEYLENKQKFQQIIEQKDDSSDSEEDNLEVEREENEKKVKTDIYRASQGPGDH